MQYKLGNIPPSVWPGWEFYMADRIIQPKLMAETWMEMKPMMDRHFVAYVDGYERRLAKGSDAAA